MRLLRLLPWIALPAALLAASCRDPTQITVRVTTDLACHQTPGLAKAWVASAGTEVEAPSCTPQTPYNYVGTIVLVPGPAGDDAKVDVMVIGSVNAAANDACLASKKNAGDCLVVRRRLSFIPHTPLTLPIRLDSRCLNVQCKDSETCIEGVCKPIDFEPPPPIDAGADGDVPDAPPAGPPLKATAIFASGNATCAVTVNRDVVCWGDDTGGILFGGSVASMPPTGEPLLAGMTSIAFGVAHGCALFPSGVQCWGDNGAYQLGAGLKVTRSDSPVPVSAPVDGAGIPFPIKSWGPVTAGDAFTCASVVTTNSAQDVACWGKDAFGQASGKGATGSGTVPIPTIIGIPNAVGTPAAGPDFACSLVHVKQCLSNCAYATCWGADADSQCGVGPLSYTTPTTLKDVAFSGLTVWAGGAHVVATNGGVAWAWGRNAEKQLGSGKIDPFPPGPIEDVSDHFALGATSTCSVTSGGKVTCRGSGEVVTTPQSLVGVTDIAGGRNHVCALLTDQTVHCWGRNNLGQLGGGDAKDVGPRVVEAP